MNNPTHLRVLFRSLGWKEFALMLAIERAELAGQLTTLSPIEKPEEIARLQGRIWQIDALLSGAWQEKALDRLDAKRRQEESIRGA